MQLLPIFAAWLTTWLSQQNLGAGSFASADHRQYASQTEFYLKRDGFRATINCETANRPDHLQYRLDLSPRVLYKDLQNIVTLRNPSSQSHDLSFTMQKGIESQFSTTDESAYEFRMDYSTKVSAGVEYGIGEASVETQLSFGASYSNSRSVTRSDLTSTVQETQTQLTVPPWSEVDLLQLVIVGSPLGPALADTTLFTSHYSVAVRSLNPQPEHCNNGLMDGDEEGIDCGGSCLADCACCSSSSSSPNLVINSDNVTIADTCSAGDTGTSISDEVQDILHCLAKDLHAIVIPSGDASSSFASMIVEVSGYTGSISALKVRAVHQNAADQFATEEYYIVEAEFDHTSSTTDSTTAAFHIDISPLSLSEIDSLSVDFEVPSSGIFNIHPCTVHGIADVSSFSEIIELGRRLETAEDDLEANTLCDRQRRCCWGHFCSTKGGVYGDSSVWGPAAGRYDVTPGKLQNLINCYEWCGHLSCHGLNATIAGDPDRWICMG